MIQAYSENLNVITNDTIALNNITLKTGNTVTLNGNTLTLNAPGIYHIEVNSYGASTEAGTIGLKLQSNGNDIKQAKALATTGANAPQAISFNTLIPVQKCPCMTGKTINIIYTGAAGVIGFINVIVTKIR